MGNKTTCYPKEAEILSFGEHDKKTLKVATKLTIFDVAI